MMIHSRSRAFLAISLALVQSALCAAPKTASNPADQPGRITLPAGDQADTALWRYTTTQPEAGWESPAFKDSAWQEGKAGFGSAAPKRFKASKAARVQTEWTSPEIWMRRSFQRQGGRLHREYIRIWHEGDAEIYINGQKITSVTGTSSKYVYLPAEKDLPIHDGGGNVIAVHCIKNKGSRFIDVGILDLLPPVDDARVEPRTAEDVVRLQKPLFKHPVRDMGVQRGHDGAYYMTATAGYPDFWSYNDGSIPVWRSEDFKDWKFLGNVWSFKEASPWLKEMFAKRGQAALWAPELHYVKNNYYIVYSTNQHVTGLLRSTSGKAEGPYENVTKDGPLTSFIDPSLFQDDDGSVYLLIQNGLIAKMKDDMSGLAEELRPVSTTSGHGIGFEGVSLFKANGRYYLSCAENTVGSYGYATAVAMADNIHGPYGEPYIALPHAGHNNFMKDGEGNWWASMFGFDGRAPFYEQPGLFRVTFDEQGRVLPLGTQDTRLATRHSLIPMGEKSTPWRFTATAPAEGWNGSEFDASSWNEGPGGFASPNLKLESITAKTEWTGKEIWLRQQFDMPAIEQALPVFTFRAQGKITGEVYLNGVPAAQLKGGTKNRIVLSPEARQTLKPGRNVLALRLTCEVAKAAFDAGLTTWEMPVSRK